jgi:alcohol dehydrogenase class IV
MYDGVLPNPPIKVVEKCVLAYSEGTCDSIIIVGGGSSIDTAKCAGVIASNGGEIAAYFGAGKVKNRMPFTIAIPTTYGTGSEVTPFAVITDDENFKAAVRGDEIIPDIGLLDSDLAVRLPLPVAAATGMDAMTHAIESYVANTSNAIADASALQAIRMVAENIRQAASSDHNHDATEQMLVASALAGVAFSQTLLGNVHAMSHPVSGHYGVPHGVANAILLPHIMEFNLLACPDRFADIASALGEDIDGLSDTEAAEAAVDAVETLNDELGIPTDLTEAGAQKDGIPKMAEDAMKSINIQLNPRKTSHQDVITLYEEAF